MSNEVIGVEQHEVAGDIAVGRNVAIGGNVQTKGNHLILGDVTIEGWLNAPNIRTSDDGYHLDINSNGDNFLAFGESIHLRCSLWKGMYLDMTNTVERWTITRDTGRTNEDMVWNLSEKARRFDGEIDIEFSSRHNDLGDSATARFTITAHFSDIQVNRILEI